MYVAGNIFLLLGHKSRKGNNLRNYFEGLFRLRFQRFFRPQITLIPVLKDHKHLA